MPLERADPTYHPFPEATTTPSGLGFYEEYRMIPPLYQALRQTRGRLMDYSLAVLLTQALVRHFADPPATLHSRPKPAPREVGATFYCPPGVYPLCLATRNTSSIVVMPSSTLRMPSS